jgi:hypothetical protein
MERFFERQNENGGMHLQKNQESTKEHNTTLCRKSIQQSKKPPPVALGW